MSANIHEGRYTNLPPRRKMRRKGMTLELAFDEIGSGPPVVILHGLFGSSSNWRGIARRLAASHRVISADLRNHGASPWADTMDYPAMADDVRALVERTCAAAPPAVIGHSMGGKTAMALALLYPQQVERLIVVDIAPLSYADTLTPFAEAMRSVDVAAASRAEVQRRLAKLVPDPTLVPFLMQNLVSRNEHFDWRVNLVAIQTSMHELSAFPAHLRTLSFERPTHAIAGGRSNYVPRDASAFLPMFPQINLQFIETAGHWVHADRPDDFAAAVQTALS